MAERRIQRVMPLTVTESQRQYLVAAGTGEAAIDGQELVTTSDERRLFRGREYIGGGVDHGTVVSAGAMAAIYLLPSCTRGVWPNDSCFRSDVGCEYRCVSGHNSTALWRAATIFPDGGGGISTAADIRDLWLLG